MKSKSRLAILSLVVAIVMFGAVLSPALQVNAQSNQCFGLSSDDCALANGTSQPGAMQKLTSFNMAYQLTFSGNGPQGNTADFSVKGSGPFAVDATGVNSLSNGDMNAVAKLTMANTLSWSSTTDGQTKTGNFEFRIVNGTLYFQGDNATQGKWKSVDLQQAARSRNFGSMGRGMFGQSANPAQMLAMLGALHKLADTPGFISAERTADTTVEGQQVATFVYHFDVQKLLTSPNFATFLKTIGSQNPRLQNLSDRQIQAMLGGVSAALQNSQISITRQIGVTDKLPHGFGVDVVLNVDPKVMAGMMAMMPSSNATQAAEVMPVKANLHFLVTLTGIGNKVTVEVPAGATPVDLNSTSPEGGATAEPTAAS